MRVIFDPLAGALRLIGSSSGGTIGIPETDEFIATDGQTNYPLSHAPLPGTPTVTINGLRQPKTEYVVTGTAFAFNDGTGIVAGDVVAVRYWR